MQTLVLYGAPLAFVIAAGLFIAEFEENPNRAAVKMLVAGGMFFPWGWFMSDWMLPWWLKVLALLFLTVCYFLVCVAAALSRRIVMNKYGSYDATAPAPPVNSTAAPKPATRVEPKPAPTPKPAKKPAKKRRSAKPVKKTKKK